jgi:hypothetical protein
VEFEIQQGNKRPLATGVRGASPIPPLGQQPASLEGGGLLPHRPVVGIRPDRPRIPRVNRRSGKKRWLRCPVLSYVIEHPDGLLL